MGERWLVGTGEDEASSVVLEVTLPRIPWREASRAGWANGLGQALHGRRGSRAPTCGWSAPGTVRSGDPITVVFTPTTT